MILKKIFHCCALVICVTSIYAQNTLTHVLESKPYVTSLSGDSVLVSEVISSTAPVGIHFWATWCSPCRKEIPILTDEYEKNSRIGFQMIGLTVEPYPTSKQKVMDFITKYKINYPVYFCSPEVYHLFNQSESSDPVFIPRLYFFYRDGNLAAKFEKWNGLTSEKKIREVISNLKR